MIDTSTHQPAVARLSAEALHGRVGRYLYVSSISAYADLSTPPVEGAPTAAEPPDEYGPLKAASERTVEDVFGDRALIVRPGLIVGPHDPSGRFTYWPHRIARGGDVLAPGSPDDPKQFIDVRDLGEWMELPLWIASREFAGMQQADVSKAIGAGLTLRPLEETVRATLAEAEPVEGVGLAPERERELLAF